MIVDKWTNPNYYPTGMHEFLGKIVTIAGESINKKTAYNIKEDNRDFIWEASDIAGKIVKQDSYEVGDKVLLIDKNTSYDERVQKYLGKIATVDEIGSSYYDWVCRIKEDNGKDKWFVYDIQGKVF